MRKLLSIIITVSVLVLSCDKTNTLEKEIEAITLDVTIERFDIAFMSATSETLGSVKTDYPFLFPKQFQDSVWINKINDTLQQDLSVEVSKKFNNISDVENDIESLFKHLKYYNNTFKTPRVITVFSDWDYRRKNRVTDSIVLISLDTYLGADHEFYEGVQKYLAQNFDTKQIIPDLAEAYATQAIYQSNRKTLLDEMIYYGKIYYFKDVMTPFVDDKERIGYTQEEFQWAITNESNIWAYFIEKELLFDTDAKLIRRFINPAPFSRFNLELDNESPGRIGRYIGWQIVRAYVKNNDVTLNEVLKAEAEDIFNKSKFKPRQ